MFDTLITAIRGGNLAEAVLMLAQQLIIVLIALTVHEVAHGFVAMKLGDDTARNYGRLSLNPMKHLDPYGFICMLLFGFGWAKPVPIRAGRFKNPRVGMAVSALAGPVSNLLMAFIILIPYAVLWNLVAGGVMVLKSEFAANLFVAALEFIFAFHYINISLAIFNFIPVPPLDGSRVLWAVLPDKLYFGVMKYEQIISVVLMALLFIGVLDGPLSFLTGAVSDGMLWLINLFSPISI